jgi:hypothetical protein
MRRLVTWLAGIAGIAALLRRRSRQRLVIPPSLPAPAATDPAVELRQRLDQTRTAVPEPPAEPEATVSLDDRRARVHERAMEAIDLMHGPDTDKPGQDKPRQESTE